MPLYDCECQVCGEVKTVFRPLSEYDDMPVCHGAKMKRLVSAPFIQPDNTCYKSMVTGEMVTSRTRHKQILKDFNLIEVGNEKVEKRQKTDSEKKEASYQLKREIAQRLSAKGDKAYA